MRTISAPSLAKLATRYGTEPVNILEIVWVDEGSTYSYADRDIEGTTIPGRILSINELDSVINVSQNGQTAKIDITLDDTDGSIKAILDQHDIHKRPAYLYQWFEGLDVAEKFIIFRGEINSPITWKEGDRTISFSIVAKLEDQEIGFSPEEGEFPSIPDRLVGRPWPMIFGTALDVPAVNLTEPALGIVTSAACIADFTIPLQLDVLATQISYTTIIRNIYRDLRENAIEEAAAANQAAANATTDAARAKHLANRDSNLDAADDYASRETEAETRISELLEQVSDLTTEYASQQTQETSVLEIISGGDFPQGEVIQLDIDGGLFTGYFSGTTFHITSRRHPQFGEVTTPHISIFISTRIPGNFFNPNEFNPPRELVAYTEEVTGESASFFVAKPGAHVKIAGTEPVDNVVSIVPGTVLSVSARRAFEGARRLVTVPPDRYTVRNETFGSITAVIVRLNKPLSSYDEEGWEDELFVTFESDVGPNTVDVLEYLIDLYTPDLTVDATTFNHVRTRLDPYPSNFALLERKNILQVLSEITRQARCAIWLSGDTFYLRYLPEVPTSIASFTESDISAGTMEITHTVTEDLVTKLTAEWRSSYAAEDPNKIILKHNVKKYGTQEATEEYYIYNSQELVIKSATFWLIRMANTWKRISFRTPLHKLAVETYDGVTLDFNSSYVADTDIIALVEQANYDSTSHELSFTLWTPVKAGTMVAYDFAWPADVDQNLIFPTVEEEFTGNAGGNGPGKDANGVLTPTNTITIPGYRARQDYGDPKPSDHGDTAPLGPVTVNTGLFNNSVPTNTTPAFQTNPYSPKPSDAVIDIRKTVILDSQNGNTSRLSSFFRNIVGNQLRMDADAMVDDGTHAAPFDFKYDTITEAFGAGTAFLEVAP